MALNNLIAINYICEDTLKLNLKERLNRLGSNIVFEEDTWICDKLKNSESNDKTNYTLYFSQIPSKYKEIVKYFCLARDVRIRTISANLSAITHFLKFLYNEWDSVDLIDVDKRVINSYKIYLTNENTKKRTKEGKWSGVHIFFETMKNFKDMPNGIPISKMNPFKTTRAERKNKNKYIHKSIIRQFDVTFKDENIPLEYRLIYWLLRLIPSRVSEVVGMKFDCVKPYGRDFIIEIPTWKENGGYREPEYRLIRIKETGMGKYLLDLIRKQKEVVENLVNEYKDLDKDMLFLVQTKRLNGAKYKKTGQIEYVIDCKRPKVYKESRVTLMLQRIAKRYNIRDEKGKIYKITSHQLRHNGITDRLYAGFSTLEIRDMTGGKSDIGVLDSYYHTQPEKNKDINKKLLDKKFPSKRPIYFKGRILNFDNRLEKKLLKNPRAYEINDGNLCLGICTDITSCRSGLFECLACDYFAPKTETLSYYEKEVRHWEEKVKLFKNNREARENAKYNLSLYKAITERIKSTISRKIEDDAK